MSDDSRELEAIYLAASAAYFDGEQENVVGEDVENLIVVMEANAEDHEEDALGAEPGDSAAQAALLRLAVGLLRSSQQEALGRTRSFFAVEAMLVIQRYKALD